MASADFTNLTLRNTTTYNPDGSFVSTGYVFTVGTNGRQNWTNNLVLNNLTANNILLNQTLVIASTITNDMTVHSTLVVSTIQSAKLIDTAILNGSTINTNTLTGSTINYSTLIGSTIYASTVYSNLINYSSLTGSTIDCTTLTGSTINVDTINYSTLTGSTITSNTIVLNSSLITSTFTTNTFQANLFVVSTLSSVATYLIGSTLGNVGGNTAFITQFGSGYSGPGSDKYGGVEMIGRRTVTGTDWPTTNMRLRKFVDTTPMCYIDFGRNSSDPQGMGFGQNNTERMCITEGGNVGIGTTTPISLLHIAGSTTTNAIVVNSTLLGSTINTINLTFSTMVGSTITSNTQTINSTLIGSTINTTNLTTTAGQTFIGKQEAYPNRYIELGTDSVNTAYIDFHAYNASDSDYSTRIESSGGLLGGLGAGTLTLTGQAVNIAATLSTTALNNIITKATLFADTVTTTNLSQTKMTGALNMNSNNITNAGTITTSNLSGTTMTGTLNMNSNNITNAGTVTTSNLSGTTMTGPLNMGSNNITTTGTVTTANLSGTAMTGPLNMNSQNINSAGTVGATTVTTTNLSGTTMTGPLNMNSQNINSAGTILGASLSVSGNINTTSGKIQEGGNPLIPSGCIIMWYGVSIPGGWRICDGGGGTPDLRSRFIVGVGPGYNLGDTGGAASVTLTTAQIPSHTHQVGFNIYGDDSGGANNCDDWNLADKNGCIGKTYTTTPVGEGQSHENRPPYFALYYIMKL